MSRWSKIWRDIWFSKTRTLLVTLSITIGVFAVGVVMHMNQIISRDLQESYTAIHPANVTIYTSTLFDQDLLNSVRRMEGVLDADARRSVTVRFKVPEHEEWFPIQLTVLADYRNIRVNQVRRELTFNPNPDKWPSGVWPPSKREVVLERTSLLLAQLGLSRSSVGTTMTVETPGGSHVDFKMVGLAYDFNRLPATFAGTALGFIDQDTLELLGVPRDFNEIHLRVSGTPLTQDRIRAVSSQIKQRIENGGVSVERVELYEPNKLPLDYMFRAISLILGVLGVLLLALSCFLVINTTSALLAQQVRQIGIMKTFGGRTYQIAMMYLSMVLVFGAFALVPAIPLAIVGAAQFIDFLAYFLNFQSDSVSVPPVVIIGEILTGLLVPVIAALYPVLHGTSLTVYTAINTNGRGQDVVEHGLFERLTDRFEGISRPLLLSVRNMFRRKGRLLLTTITMTAASATFVMVMSSREAMDQTVEEAFAYRRYDVQVQFRQPIRLLAITEAAKGVRGIQELEGWGSSSTYRLHDDGTASQDFAITAPPADTRMLQPTLLQGRWLLPGDENALVINERLLRLEPDLQIGRELVLKLRGKKTRWQVVGVIRTVDPNPQAYANYSSFSRSLRQFEQVTSINVVTTDHSAKGQSEVANALQEAFEQRGIDVMGVQTIDDLRSQNAALFNIITTLLMAMAALLAVVGGLGLAGSMGLNVLERTREIGVMRAIGATNQSVLQIVMIEGVLIGLVSWLLGCLLAAVLQVPFANALGQQLFQVPLTYLFSVRGAFLWLALVVSLSALASYGPARNSLRVTVVQALVQE